MRQRSEQWAQYKFEDVYSMIHSSLSVQIISGQPVGDSPARVDEVQCHELGLMPQSEWKVFKLKSAPGGQR